MIDLAVAYRVYPGISKAPAFFPDDKFRLTKMCLESFRGALGGLRVKIFALLDGCPAEYESLFRETLHGYDPEILTLDKIGNHATFALQIDLLTGQTEAPFVYFAEDDYFYLSGAIEKMVTFMRENTDADFVTPYDHPDSYYTSSCFERHLVRPFGDRYWRTASSTCLTFLASRKSLVRNRDIFRTYCRGNRDCSVWLILTQKFALANAKIHWANRSRVSLWIRTWIWGFNKVLFGRRYRLWVPLPTLATHMESTGMAPLIDWQSEFVRAKDASSTTQLR